MDALGVRLVLLANVVIPFVFFMAAIYLALHMLMARIVTSPASPLLWFFGVVTGPLTRPVRRFLTPARPESQVRAVALAFYVALWLASRVLFVWLGGPRQG